MILGIHAGGLGHYANDDFMQVCCQVCFRSVVYYTYLVELFLLNTTRIQKDSFLISSLSLTATVGCVAQ